MRRNECGTPQHQAEFAAHEALRRIALHLGPDDESGELPLNGESYLKSANAMARLFADRPDAVENAARLAERLAPPLDATVRHLPRYPKLPDGETAFSFLSCLALHGMKKRYGAHPTSEVSQRLLYELEVIRDLGYCDYFLICKDVCDEARRREVGFALRGSAVGSAVAYCLGMSPHDPIARRISFERFLSKARKKPPDIDIDFRHDARDAIMDYTRETYGHDKVAGVANYVTWRGRSLLRDVGKVLGVAGGEIDRLRELLWHSKGDDLEEKLLSQPELTALGIEPSRYADLFALCATLSGLPRHLGTHSSGIVVSGVPLASVCPVMWAAKGVQIAALDKDDVEAPGIGLLKMDQLCLRALTAVDIAVGRVKQSDPGFDYDGRDREDADTLAMIRQAETVGVFQLESPAQQALQWRLQAVTFDDLIASVALIRPGPLVGGTVEPYISKRRGWTKPTYPLPELEPVLRETYGRILFQDQVLDVVAVVGDYSLDKADTWLKAMTHARSEEAMKELGLELLSRAKSKGLSGKAFEKLWKQIKGFARYGFCEGHSVAFASHAQGTAYLLRHYPAEFLSAILSVEPCGFWPVATVTAEANRRGVPVLGPCLNRSGWRQWSLETMEALDVPMNGPNQQIQAMRCSLGFVQGVSHAVARAIVEEREINGPFTSVGNAGRRLWSCPATRWNGWLLRARSMACARPGGKCCGVCPPCIARPVQNKTRGRAGSLSAAYSPLYSNKCAGFYRRGAVPAGMAGASVFTARASHALLSGAGSAVGRAVLLPASRKQAGGNGANCWSMLAPAPPADPIWAGVRVFHARRRNGYGSGDGRARCIRAGRRGAVWSCVPDSNGQSGSARRGENPAGGLHYLAGRLICRAYLIFSGMT